MRQREETFETSIEEEADPFAALTRKPAASESAPAAAPTVVTAQLQRFDLLNQPLISGVPGLAGELVVARSSVPLSNQHVGCAVVVLFEQNDLRRPIIVGVLQTEPKADAESLPEGCASVQADRRHVVLSADEEIVLRCGEASITLTRAGKVLIKGAYVSSRSSGVNRIKGGSVQIN